MASTTTRRRFLGRSVQGLGLLALAGRPGSSRAAESPAAEELVGKAVAFLRPPGYARGLVDRAQEPGITALVVTALLRSKRVTPAEPVVTKAPGLPRSGSSGPRAGSPRRRTRTTRPRSP